MTALSLPVVRAGRELGRVSHRAAGETLESCRAGVDTERHPVRVQLLLDEFMESLLDLAHTGQLHLPQVVEDLLRCRLEVPGVLSHALGRALAAGAHTAVVAQSALVQVGMVQSLPHTDPLLRVEGQHLAQEVDGLVGGGGPEGVEGGHGGRFAAPGQHVSLGCLAGVLHVGQGGRPQQVGDQLQLLDRRRGLK